MKQLHIALPVQYKFFGGAKPIESQSFDNKLEAFSQKAYAEIPEEHSNLRARFLIDTGVNAIRSLLRNIWNTPEKLDKVKWPVINAYMQIDNDYTAYSVTVIYREALICPPLYEQYESDNFEGAMQSEKDEMFQKYGFTELPRKKYRVRLENHEAILDERQLADLRKEQPDSRIDVVELFSVADVFK